MTHVVAIGAGQAGFSLVAKLRNGGFDGNITLIGEEHAPPYQRPPLSKGYLLGNMGPERLFLRPEKFYSDNDITLRLGQRVTAVDAKAKTVTVGGDLIQYDQLVLTTGASPRRLPTGIGGSLESVHVVRNIDHVNRMASEFRAGARVLIVGGGYIGLEAAAVATAKGLNVTLVEMAHRILQRIAAPETSAYFRELHRDRGVKILEGVGVKRILGDKCVSGALLTDGQALEVDFVIVGVGIDPNTDLAEKAGVALENGIKTDAQGRTSVSHIWAAGDCASFPYKGTCIRLESVPNAIDQAEVVAENIMGAGKDYVATPWFWSDQYDVKLQITGLNKGFDRVVTRAVDEGATSFWYYKGDVLIAVDAMNAPRDYMIAKRLIESGKSPSPELIVDPLTNMKALINA